MEIQKKPLPFRKFEENRDMEAVLDKRKTVEDYLQLPEGAPYQLLNGELVMSPSPKRLHQKLSLRLASAILQWVEQKNLGDVYDAPFDVHLDEENVVQPDICFFSQSRLSLLSDRGAEGGPDLVIEILSTGNAYYDMRYKRDLYERFGVTEYFIIDPTDNTVICYRLHEGRYKEQYVEKGLLRSEVLQTELRF